MTKIEEILNSKISELQHGSPAGAGFRLPQNPEMDAMLKIASILNSMPKRNVPEPVMQRKFALAPEPAKSFWRFITLPRLALASTLIMMFSIGTVSYYSAKSLPGQNLFTLKRASERLSLQLTTDPVEKANMELALAQKRLNEAEQVIQSPTKDPQLEIAALNELTAQTNSALDQVKTVASSKTITNPDHPILNSVETISQKQMALVSQVQAQTDLKDQTEMNKLAQETQNKVTEIKNLVMAASNEQDLTILPPVSKEQATSTPAETASTSPEKSALQSTKTKQATGSSTTESVKADKEAQEQTATPPDPNTAVGGFLPEDPTPLFGN